MLKIIFVLLGGISFVSCETGPMYQQGSPDLGKSAMFVSQTKMPGSIFWQTTFGLGNIDGMRHGRNVCFSNGEYGIAVTPGEHRIGVGMIHAQPGTGLVTAEGEVPMKVQVGKIYEVMGSMVNLQRANLWVRERYTKKQVSPAVSVAATDHGLPTPMILIPTS